MADKLRVVVVTSNDHTWRDLSSVLSSLELDCSRAATVEECKHVFRRDKVDVVFSDDRVDDGDYWEIYGALTRGLIVKPKVVLMTRDLDVKECEQAKQCGMFAVIESPCRKSSVEWAIILAKRSARSDATPAPYESLPKFDIFSGAPDRDAVWVCAVRGLANARERMEDIASETPGRYFIFYAPDRSILAQTETFAEPRARRNAQSESA
jgi:CheY-like chemotaxis protein